MHPAPRPAATIAAALALLGPLLATEVRAQGVAPGAAGAVAGLAVGSLAAVGVITARAHLAGDYLDRWGELVPVPAALALGGLAHGVLLGTSDAEALRRASVAALLAGSLGTGIGVLAGRALLDPETGPWAGALMGAATGSVVGWLLGALLGPSDAGPAASAAFAFPVGPGGGR